MNARRILALLLIVCLLALPILAQEEEESEEEEAIEAMGMTMQGVNSGLALFIVIAGILVVIQAGRILSGSFLWLTISIFYFGAISVFFLLAEFMHVIAIEDISVALAWHFMFYIATSLFIVALRRLQAFGQTHKQMDESRTAFIFFLLGGVLVAIFFSVKMLDPWLARYEGTFWDTFGLIHFVAATFIGYTAMQLFRLRKSFGRVITAAVKPFIVSLIAFTLVHAWELLAESWKVVDIGEAGEVLESVLYFIAITAMLYAVWQIKRRSQVKQ